MFTTGAALAGCATSRSMLVVTRVLRGMGGAMLSPVGRLILLRCLPKPDLARTMAYVAIPVPIPLPAAPGFLPLAATDGVGVSRHRVRAAQPAR